MRFAIALTVRRVSLPATKRRESTDRWSGGRGPRWICSPPGTSWPQASRPGPSPTSIQAPCSPGATPATVTGGDRTDRPTTRGTDRPTTRGTDRPTTRGTDRPLTRPVGCGYHPSKRLRNRIDGARSGVPWRTPAGHGLYSFRAEDTSKEDGGTTNYRSGTTACPSVRRAWRAREPLPLTPALARRRVTCTDSDAFRVESVTE
jgi:hypothetical protein